MKMWPLSLEPMDHPRMPTEAAEHVHSALEASCDALIALETISAGVADEQHAVRATVAPAMRAVRLAIAEMRLALGDDVNTLATGFVLRAAQSGAAPGGD
jgi:hypothetical protein